MKPLVVLTAVAAAAAALAAPSNAHLPKTCTAKQPAQVELRCATHNKHHAQAAITWARSQKAHRIAGFSAVQNLLLAGVIKNHRWLYRESEKDQAEARHRLSRILPETNDWLTAVRVVQRVFPGSAWWQTACSSSEGGHGSWVPNRQGSGAGGWMQYMEGTFWGDFRSALSLTRERGFVVPRSAHSWYSALGQALASGYAYHYNRPTGKWTGYRC
jgi:hypothetical protein